MNWHLEDRIGDNQGDKQSCLGGSRFSPGEVGMGCM